MPKLFYVISWATIFSAMGLLILLGYWYFITQVPVTFSNLPHKVENKTVVGGEYVIYDVDYCKYSDVVPQLNKSFIDGIIYNVPPIITEVVSKGCGTNRIFMYVPRSLPPGKYVIKITYRYQVNPIKTVTVSTATEQFEVIK